VRTLYDNWERAVARYPNVPALGNRNRNSKGHLGPYKWLTYAQVCVWRCGVGSV